VQRSLWRGQAVYIRSLFDANRGVKDPRQQRVCIEEGIRPCNKLIRILLLRYSTTRRKSYSTSGSIQIHIGRQQRPEVWSRPQRAFTAPSLTFIIGSKFERNLPAPDLPRESLPALFLAIIANIPSAPTSEQVRNL
jgi:hypothetical protein